LFHVPRVQAGRFQTLGEYIRGRRIPGPAFHKKLVATKHPTNQPMYIGFWLQAVFLGTYSQSKRPAAGPSATVPSGPPKNMFFGFSNSGAVGAKNLTQSGGLQQTMKPVPQRNLYRWKLLSAAGRKQAKR